MNKEEARDTMEHFEENPLDNQDNEGYYCINNNHSQTFVTRIDNRFLLPCGLFSRRGIEIMPLMLCDLEFLNFPSNINRGNLDRNNL
jgi:hypothetical protein